MENTDNKEQFPGYPHYPASEDITNTDKNNGRAPLTEEGAPEATGTTDATTSQNSDTVANDADITSEDLELLDASEQNMGSEDGLNLQHARLDNLDDDGDEISEGDELDVPGSEDDDTDEQTGEEDEENNYYSLGGDLHEGQEENKGE